MLGRFVSNILVLTLGGILVAISLAMAPATVGWVAFAVGCAALVTTSVAFLASGRGAAQRSLDLLISTVAAWTIFASLAFAGSALRWLSFGEATALCLLGLAGLIGHEMIMERAARTPAGTAAPAPNGRAPEAAVAPAPTPSRAGAW